MIENKDNIGMNENDFRELDTDKKILHFTSQYKVPYVQTKEEAYAQLKAKIDLTTFEHVQDVRRIKILPLIGKLAACIVLIFGAWYLWIRKPLVNIISDKGQHTECQLPDGSLISINAESKISYKKDKFNTNRHVILDGEAFFKVTKGKSFTIDTKLANIEVLGTSFNVFARDNSFKVTCFTGKIRVSSGKESLIIIPGESAVLTNNTLHKYIDKNIQTIGNWRTGEFYFENSSLASVFKEIERQFNVTFVLPEINEKIFTGSFSNKNLVNTLDIVCIPMGLTYEIGSNSKIFIKKKLH